MKSLLKPVAKVIFFFLLMLHFAFLIVAFCPTKILLASINEQYQWLEPSSIPKEVTGLKRRAELIPVSHFLAETRWARLSEKLLLWRRDHLMKDEQRLALDLSALDFGDGIMGMEAASDYYFKKPLDTLSPDEWILLLNLNKIFLK